ncbi:MAG: VanW family protein [Myxococcota bacterium]
MPLRPRALLNRTGAALGVAVTAGLAIGLLLVPRGPGPGDDSEPLPETRLLGKALPKDEQASKVALSRARAFLAGRFQLTLPDGAQREIYLGQLGAELDKVYLANLVRDARDRTSSLLRVYRAADTKAPLELPLPITLDPTLAVATLLAQKDELDRVPVDARLDLEKRELVKETWGRLLDVDASLAKIQAALRSGKSKAELVFHEQRPRRIAKELGNVEFGQVLGFFETRYDRSQRQEARTYNLRLAASRLDGYVLLPGEVFDFNAVVGPRDEANGYKVAPVIAEGELVDGIGGGTCQISGTLHGAAFFAGLGIVERYPHTRPSSYIKMGLDATVVYPTINFRVKNPFDFPIVFHETVKNGVVRAEVLGPKRALTVTFIRRVLDAIPYEEVERPDKDLPHGLRVLGQRGVPGFKLRRYRIVRDGDHAVRDRWDDVYPPTTQIVRVGTGDSGERPLKATDDPHPEYLADELLVMTQGVDADEDGGSNVSENREPGRFGENGWTEAAGMPYFRAQHGDRAAERPERDSKAKRKSRKNGRSDKQT